MFDPIAPVTVDTDTVNDCQLDEVPPCRERSKKDENLDLNLKWNTSLTSLATSSLLLLPKYKKTSQQLNQSD